MYLVNGWVSTDSRVLKKLATFESDSKDLFYRVYLSTSIFNETVGHSLTAKDYGDDKKAKKSLKRLHARIQDL